MYSVWETKTKLEWDTLLSKKTVKTGSQHKMSTNPRRTKISKWERNFIALVENFYDSIKVAKFY